MTRPTLAGGLLAVLLSACGGDPGAGSTEAPESATAQRVVTLAPHLAELVFAAGAGETLVGVSAYTDYPPEAAALPIVGDAFGVDQEQLRLLRPDVVLAWANGMPASTVDELRASGLDVVPLDTSTLASIAETLETIGQMTGNATAAAREAQQFEDGIDALRQRYAARQSVRVFYQISERPLYTINGDHFISEMLEVCGARNIFEDLSELAPAVDVEAVLARAPDAILGGGRSDALDEWQRFEALPATRLDNLLRVESDHLARASTRLISAGEVLCDVIDDARSRL